MHKALRNLQQYIFEDGPVLGETGYHKSIFVEGNTSFRYVTKDVAIKSNHLQFSDFLFIGSVIFLL